MSCADSQKKNVFIMPDQERPFTIKTRVTELLGTRYPIIQGGMQWVGRAELASAVSNAGGLGILTGLTQPTPEALATEIGRCRSMTDEPFGVNLTMLPSRNPPPYEAYLDVVIASGVKVLETAGLVPDHFIPKARDAAMPCRRNGVAWMPSVSTASRRQGIPAKMTSPV